MITVRKATTADMDWLMSELKTFSLFYGSSHQLFGNEEFARRGMAEMIEKHLVMVADKAGVGPVGLIAGLLVPHIFNPLIRVLSETFWWVPEKWRRTRAGLLLIQAFIEFGKQNVDWILCTLEENSPINPDALIKRGFKLKERNFLMEVV